jgi:hypothetical protein
MPNFSNYRREQQWRINWEEKLQNQIGYNDRRGAYRFGTHEYEQ